MKALQKKKGGNNRVGEIKHLRVKYQSKGKKKEAGVQAKKAKTPVNT